MERRGMPENRSFISQDYPEIGDERTVFVFEGRGDTLIGRLPSGVVVLFDKDSSLWNDIEPGCTVDSTVKFIRENYVIVEPNRILDEDEAIKANLEDVASASYYHHAVLARALLYMIERIE